ncbi:MAG: hypothetical protein RIS35_354, partial [Pseudomonadota bacterium]
MNHPTLHPDALRRPVPEALLDALRDRFADRFSTAEAVREHHGKDESPFPPTPPDGVVFAEAIDDIVDAVTLCRAHKVPLIPFGSGSSLEGHLLAVQGGISLDVSRMNAVLSINAEDLTATVQAGVTRKQLNEALHGTGLFFPIDPGADASLGGMSATRASGTNAVRYGTMKENVLGLTVVTADGKVIKTARRARKSSAGYDLTRLFVGSEGTLGVITEVTLRLAVQPESIVAAV